MPEKTIKCVDGDVIGVRECVGGEANVTVDNLLDPYFYSVRLTQKQRRKLARAIDPLYVIKSAAGNYLTFPAGGAVWNRVEWTPHRHEAAHFVTKAAAKAVLKPWKGTVARPKLVKVAG